MADYSSSLALASRLIGKKGMEVVFMRMKQDGAVDPVTGKRTVIIEETRCMGVITRPTKDELAAGRFQNVSQALLVPGNAVKKPTVADKFRFSGHVWEITEILEVAPAGVPVLYKFGLKDGGLL